MPVDLELWNRLNDFQLDDPNAAFRFSDRLARENGWSKTFARRAVDEYKKFVYLAATSDTPVTPSDVVDQVWHLHLTFTRSYWDEMCSRILGRALHHGPTKGGPREDTKYRKQYAETLAVYRGEFGTEPPVEYWPHADARFASAPYQRWVDTRTHFIIRKPKIAAPLAGIVLATTGTTAAVAADGAAEDSNMAVYVMGAIIAMAVLIFGLMSGIGGKKRDKSKDNGCGAGCGGGGAGCGGCGGGCGGD